MSIGAIATVAGPPIIQGISNFLTNKNNRKHSVDMWEKDNEYNHPSQQMARLQEAGINPHLAFSQGNINNVSSGQPQVMPMAPPQFDSSNLMTPQNIDESQSRAALNRVQEQTESWRTKQVMNQAKISDVEAILKKGMFQFDEDGNTVGISEQNARYADMSRQMYQAGITEQEAKEMISTMERDLAKKNLTPQTDVLYRILSKIFDEMGFNL